MSSQPAYPPLTTDRLSLAPLKIADAGEMVNVLGATELYAFTGGHSLTRQQLEDRYRAQVAGPPEGDEVWHNWIVRLAETRLAVGFVQATVIGDEADVAWLIGVDHQRQGIAREAASAMCGWLTGRGVRRLTAHIHPQHLASERVAVAVGLQRTDEVDDEGEVVWASVPGSRVRSHKPLQ